MDPSDKRMDGMRYCYASDVLALLALLLFCSTVFLWGDIAHWYFNG